MVREGRLKIACKTHFPEGETGAQRWSHLPQAAHLNPGIGLRTRSPPARGLALPPHPSASAGPGRAPVSDVVVVPLEVALKGLESAQVWDAAARGPHGLQGGFVQLSSLRQRQAPLEKPQRPT